MQAATKKNLSDLNSDALLTALDNQLIVVTFNSNGTLIDCNENFEIILNLHKNESTVQASPLLKMLSPTDEIYQEAYLALQNGQKWRGILRFQPIHLPEQKLDTTITPITDNTGKVVKFVAIGQDISSYYCQGKTTNAVECKEKQLVANFTDDELYINRYGKIINTSKSAVYNTYHSMIGSYIYDFINPANHQFIQKQIQQVFTKGKKRKYQSLGLSGKGNQIFYMSKLKPVFNQDHEVIYATLKSKKHKNTLRAKNQLKAIETKYSNIFQSINVGILVVANGAGNIIEWNKGAELAFGYTSSEVIGEPLTILMAENQVDAGVKELIIAKDKLDNDGYSDNMEMLGSRKTGEEFPVEFSMSHWQNGKEKFYCAFMLDISKRKKLEQKLQKATKDLELFLYRSAHDLKAPLTSAEGVLNLLKEEKLNKRGSFLVTMLDETLEKGRLLLDDLAFASIISEKRRDVTPIDFQEKISKALIALKGVENFDIIDFQMDVEQETDFYFNQELIASIIQNLIHNTICFSKPKSPNHTPTTTIQVCHVNGGLKLVVSDNGMGIKDNYLNHIFDLYFRGNTKKSTGTGLGLYIVKRIVDDFNGEITVTSKLNKGTTVQVFLPNLKGDKLNDN